MIPLLVGTTVVVWILIVFLSAVEMSSTQLTLVSLRALAERDRLTRRFPLLERAARDRTGFLLPLQSSVLVLIVGCTLLLFVICEALDVPRSLGWTFLVMSLAATLGRLTIPRLLAHRDPERLFLRLLPFLPIIYPLLVLLSSPITYLVGVSRRVGTRQNDPEQDEPSEEEIQAYLDVGEEVGIFEEQESELIQSALEFGSTLAREIMTPRNEIVAIQDTATVSELKDLIVSAKYSRIPVYRNNLENIVGVVYVRNLLSYLDEGVSDRPITPLLKKPWFVPETKKVSDLLKEMQKKSEPMAVVVNEYGSVSGLITIEDLIEELVGEIYDEDERQVIDLHEEGAGVFRVRGGVEIGELEEALGVDLGELDVTTVSGLVVDSLGEVPVEGQKFTLGELEVEVLDADRKRIKWMRIRRKAVSREAAAGPAPELPSAESPEGH